MPATITKSIKASGGDYATITLWEADIGDLTSKDELHFGQLYDEVYDEEVSFSGSVTDATRFATLQPAPGEQAVTRVEGTGPRIVSNQGADNVDVFRVNDQFFVFENFEITSVPGTNTVSSIALMDVQAGGENVTIRGLFFHVTPNGSTRGIGLNIGVGPFTVVNNFFYDLQDGTSRSFSCFLGTAVTAYIYNNTAFNSVSDGFRITADGSGAVIEVKNNIALDCGTDFTYTEQNSGTINTDKNLSSDLTADDNADGTHFISETASSILTNVTGGSEDLHLKTGTNAIGNAVDLATTPSSVEVDVDGYDRDAGAVSWDIGADQQGKTSDDNGAADIFAEDVIRIEV